MSAPASPPPPASGRPAASTKVIPFFTLSTVMLGLSILFPILAPLGHQLRLSETQVGWFSTVYSLNSSALALGRMTGPLIGTGLYQSVSHGAPYLLSGAVLLLALLWTLVARPKVLIKAEGGAVGSG